MEGAGRPKLEVVEGGASPRPPAAAPAPAADPPARRPWLWALAALVVLALLATALEARRAVRLEAQVAELSGQLEAAEAALEAHRGHLEQVRAKVSELQSLVSHDPAAGPR